MGTNRLQRGINYIGHLRKLSQQAHHPQLSFFDGGHDNKACYASPAFRRWAFGDTAGRS